MRNVALWGVAAAVPALAGCLQQEIEVRVKPDGSGTLIVTQAVSREGLEQMKKMMEEMMGGMGGAPDKTKGPQEDPSPFNEEKARAEASKYGPGVRFVSARKIEDKERVGVVATYEFDDISKLGIEQKPANPAPEMPGAPQPPSEKLTFKFKKEADGTALLTVVSPMKKRPEPAPEETPEEMPVPEEPPDDPQMEQGIEMAKQMFKGLKVSFTVKVDDLVKTNSLHVDGNTVTILAVEFDKFLANFEKDRMKALMSKQPETLEEMKEILKGVEGFKFNLEEETTIQFR